MPTTYVKVSVHKRKIINLLIIFQETNADDIFSSFAVMFKRKKSMVYLLPMPPKNVPPFSNNLVWYPQRQSCGRLLNSINQNGDFIDYSCAVRIHFRL